MQARASPGSGSAGSGATRRSATTRRSTATVTGIARCTAPTSEAATAAPRTCSRAIRADIATMSQSAVTASTSARIKATKLIVVRRNISFIL